jgi:hypothetical protein
MRGETIGIQKKLFQALKIGAHQENTAPKKIKAYIQ